MAKLSESVRSDLRHFAFYLANGTVCNELLTGYDYRVIFEEPSILEMVFAIYSNCLELDENGELTGNRRAAERVGQYIRGFVDPQYVIEPPFEPWETELV